MSTSFSWRSRRADARRCAHFSTDDCCVIHGYVISLEKCHEKGGGHSERGLNNRAPVLHMCGEMVKYRYIFTVVHIGNPLLKSQEGLT